MTVLGALARESPVFRKMSLVKGLIKSYRTRFESSCSTEGESCRFSLPVEYGPRLLGETPIGPSTLLRMVSLPFEGLRAVSLSNRSNHFVPASRGGVYIESFYDLKLINEANL